MPVLVGTLSYEVVDGQSAGPILAIAELPSPSAEVVAQLALGRFHVWIRLVVVYCHGLQRGPSTDLSDIACFDDYTL